MDAEGMLIFDDQFEVMMQAIRRSILSGDPNPMGEFASVFHASMTLGTNFESLIDAGALSQDDVDQMFSRRVGGELLAPDDLEGVGPLDRLRMQEVGDIAVAIANKALDICACQKTLADEYWIAVEANRLIRECIESEPDQPESDWSKVKAQIDVYGSRLYALIEADDIDQRDAEMVYHLAMLYQAEQMGISEKLKEYGAEGGIEYIEGLLKRIDQMQDERSR